MPKPDRYKRAARRITPSAIAVVSALLILPGAAAFRVCPPFDLRWVLGYWLLVSVVTYSLYATDKKKAERGEWRIPEATLHFCEFIGGWAAAFLAQREFRHKTVKRSYQAAFWSIVLLYQVVACDFLFDWAVSRRVWGHMPQSSVWTVLRTLSLVTDAPKPQQRL